MAFGKNQENVAGIPVYGGTTTQRAANAGRTRKRNYGNKRPYWADTLQLSETAPSIIRLVPGEFETSWVDEHDHLITETLQWFQFIEHYSGTHKRGAVCSGGPWFFRKDKRNECEGCNSRDAEGYTKGQRPAMSRSDKYAFIAIDQGLHHKMPQIDRDSGQARVNPKTNEAYTEWVKCSGRACQGCQTALEHRYGYLQPWMMAKTHFNALNAMAPAIGTCCVTCGGRSTVQPVSWHCGNQQCQTMIFDMRTSTATDEQIAAVVNSLHGCQQCHQTNYPLENIVCTNCTPNGWQPVRATIFDVDLHIQTPRTGENGTSVLQVVGMSDPCPLDPQFHDLLQYKPDLAKRFAPDSLDTQRRIWNISEKRGGDNGGYSQQPAPGPATYAMPYGNSPMQQPMVQQPMPQHPFPQQPMQQRPPMPQPVGHLLPQPSQQNTLVYPQQPLTQPQPMLQAPPPMAQVAPQVAPQGAPAPQPLMPPRGGYLPPQGRQQ